ncbi:cytochrome c peroxidase [Gallaecimonas sp. GXIMD4217]|uniref:cytochrome-c peroxidase n=1 Tax=Gallaecimonas sp. GXIMD4217 TaxID=3131927 RepID=UPI00311AF295
MKGLVLALAMVASGTALAGELQQQARALFGAAPQQQPEPAQVALGRTLFFESRIGQDGKTSCGSCHNAANGGADGRKLALGAFGRQAPRNTPTIVDVTGQVAYHWTGNRSSLADQAKKALTAPPAYAHPDLASAEARLRSLTDLAPAFARAFPGEPMGADTFARAIEAYQQSLVTRSRFDDFLAGDEGALDEQERRGLATFISVGCVSCHNGRNLGGGSFQKFGVFADYWTLTGSQQVDEGRARDSGQEADRQVFKVPPLRHVAKTAPYFHDGSVAKLDEAVAIMARLQLNRSLSERQVADIVAFLGAVTAPMPAALSPPQ